MASAAVLPTPRVPIGVCYAVEASPARVAAVHEHVVKGLRTSKGGAVVRVSRLRRDANVYPVGEFLVGCVDKRRDGRVGPPKFVFPSHTSTVHVRPGPSGSTTALDAACNVRLSLDQVSGNNDGSSVGDTITSMRPNALALAVMLRPAERRGGVGGRGMEIDVIADANPTHILFHMSYRAKPRTEMGAHGRSRRGHTLVLDSRPSGGSWGTTCQTLTCPRLDTGKVGVIALQFQAEGVVVFVNNEDVGFFEMPWKEHVRHGDSLVAVVRGRSSDTKWTADGTLFDARVLATTPFSAVEYRLAKEKALETTTRARLVEPIALHGGGGCASASACVSAGAGAGAGERSRIPLTRALVHDLERGVLQRFNGTIIGQRIQGNGMQEFVVEFDCHNSLEVYLAAYGNAVTRRCVTEGTCSLAFRYCSAETVAQAAARTMPGVGAGVGAGAGAGATRA